WIETRIVGVCVAAASVVVDARSRIAELRVRRALVTLGRPDLLKALGRAVLIELTGIERPRRRRHARTGGESGDGRNHGDAPPRHSFPHPFLPSPTNGRAAAERQIYDPIEIGARPQLSSWRAPPGGRADRPRARRLRRVGPPRGCLQAVRHPDGY